jgi:outer membrane protein assembly factor BamA
MGFGQNLHLLFRASKRKIRFQSSLFDRYYLFRGLPVQLSLYLDQTKNISYSSRKASIYAQTSRVLSTHWRAVFRTGFEQIRNYDIQESLDPDELTRDEEPFTMTYLSTTFIRDTRDSLVNPERGGVFTFEVRYAPKLFGAEIGFLRNFAQVQRYFKLNDILISAASFRYGYISKFSGDGDVPISERFFAGGPSTLRGFRIDRAGPIDPETGKPTGGRLLLIGNVELRFPIYKMIKGAAFYDTGNVFKDYSSFSWNEVSHTLGVGLRLRTALGPIRLDFGYSLKEVPNEKDYQFFITIGNPF